MKLFIDANIYLRFYDERNREFKKLLKSLLELKDYVFITCQIANEVRRNKLRIAAASFKANFKDLGVQKTTLPEHLDNAGKCKIKEWNEKRNKLIDDERILKRNHTKIVRGIVESIMLSADNVSLNLEQLFSSSVMATEGEIDAARKRKELGNPPGKHGDPLGDEISWEQLLNAYDGSEKIWLISKDHDFFVEYDKKPYLDAFLYNELKLRSKGKPSIFCFESLAGSLAHFNKISGHKIKQLPSPGLLDTIKMEEAATLQWFPVESSNIALIRYDPVTSTLKIAFHSGGIHQYFNVPQSIYEEFLSAPSKSHFFQQFIKRIDFLDWRFR